MKKLIAAFVIALAAILAARLSFFTVEEGRAALVLGWNKSVSAEVTEPGLHVKPVSYTHLTLPTICSV